MKVKFWKDMLEHDFDSTHSQYGRMDVNKIMHVQNKLRNWLKRNMPMFKKESLLPNIQLFMAEILKEDVA